jgi:hypothetical protein
MLRDECCIRWMIHILIAHRPRASVILTFVDFCVSITQLYSDVTLQLILEPNGLHIRSKSSIVEKNKRTYTRQMLWKKESGNLSKLQLLTHLDHCSKCWVRKAWTKTVTLLRNRNKSFLSQKLPDTSLNSFIKTYIVFHTIWGHTSYRQISCTIVSHIHNSDSLGKKTW